MFLRTPHHSAGVAKWAETLAISIGLLKQTNPDILAVLKRDSEALARIQDSFHTMIRVPDPGRVIANRDHLLLRGAAFEGFWCSELGRVNGIFSTC